MNRRSFLKFTGGGIVATATLAEAGMLAEFLDWLKRKPVSVTVPGPGIFLTTQARLEALYQELNQATMEAFLESGVLGGYFLPSPTYEAIMSKYHWRVFSSDKYPTYGKVVHSGIRS